MNEKLQRLANLSLIRENIDRVLNSRSVPKGVVHKLDAKKSFIDNLFANELLELKDETSAEDESLISDRLAQEKAKIKSGLVKTVKKSKTEE